MSGPAGTPCPTCGRAMAPWEGDASRLHCPDHPMCGHPAAFGCWPGKCAVETPPSERAPVTVGSLLGRGDTLAATVGPETPATPVEAPPPNAHPGKRGFCTHGVALNAPCVACHVENQREPDMARIYPNARNYTPSAEMGIAIAAAAEADAKAAAPDASVPFIASRGELAAPPPEPDAVALLRRVHIALRDTLQALPKSVKTYPPGAVQAAVDAAMFLEALDAAEKVGR